MNVKLLQTQPASFNLQNRSSFLLHFPDKLKRFILSFVPNTFRDKAKKDYSTNLPCESFREKEHQKYLQCFHLEILKLGKKCEKWSSKEEYVHILSSWQTTCCWQHQWPSHLQYTACRLKGNLTHNRLLALSSSTKRGTMLSNISLKSTL